MTSEEGRDIALAGANDGEAFARIYRRHHDLVYNVCFRYTGDPHRTEELVQDVFVRVWAKITQFSGRSSFTTWLYALTVNVARNELARTAREQWTHVSECDAFEASSFVQRIDDSCDLADAMRLLTARQREVLILHDVEGYTHAEIARRDNIAQGTAKARLWWARRRMRDLLEPGHG